MNPLETKLIQLIRQCEHQHGQACQLPVGYGLTVEVELHAYLNDTTTFRLRLWTNNGYPTDRDWRKVLTALPEGFKPTMPNIQYATYRDTANRYCISNSWPLAQIGLFQSQDTAILPENN